MATIIRADKKWINADKIVYIEDHPPTCTLYLDGIDKPLGLTEAETAEIMKKFLDN